MPSPQAVARSWWLLGATEDLFLDTCSILEILFGGATLIHITMVLLILRWNPCPHTYPV